MPTLFYLHRKNKFPPHPPLSRSLFLSKGRQHKSFYRHSKHHSLNIPPSPKTTGFLFYRGSLFIFPRIQFRRHTFISYTNKRATFEKTKHTTIPMTVGKAKDNAVHFALFVSLPMVIMVVEQGQWNSENSITLIAVTASQPLLTRSP